MSNEPSIEINGVVGTNKERGESLDEFIQWLESRGEWYGGSVLGLPREKGQVKPD